MKIRIMHLSLRICVKNMYFYCSSTYKVTFLTKMMINTVMGLIL